MSNVEQFLEANGSYVAAFGDKSSIPLPPGKKLAVVTCQDARLNPAAHLGLKEGDAHVIRNAGGIAILNTSTGRRSLVISQRMLGTREIAIFHHTDCGMLHFHAQQLRDIVTSAAPGEASVATLINDMEFYEFSDPAASVKNDVEYLKAHPLVLKETKITGWVYEVETGKVGVFCSDHKVGGLICPLSRSYRSFDR
ncbi:carbonic anhydrase [Artomyces pyxidatus]|uniref:Carbonic anhydrase n=1 Tax=Artomyces pyxidatus TaxID=48021 RepID=A0ACB8SFH2_9AGAM|nr:carbonic anhydrase [Artomyces pyxidatus]